MNSKTTKTVGVLGVLGLLGGALLLWWFFSGDPADEVSLDAATESVEATDDNASPDDATTPTIDDVSGTWTVDTSTGDFDFESATGSFVGFRIEEELSGLGSVTAVGRTGDIEGSVSIDDTTLTEASFDIDVTTLTTDDSRRDNKVQDALETDEFPSASFILSEPIELGDAAVSGEPISVPATGDLTIHGVTQEVTIDLEAQLVGDTIVIVGSTDITFSDYGVAVPEAAIVVSVDDFGVLELQLLLVR